MNTDPLCQEGAAVLESAPATVLLRNILEKQNMAHEEVFATSCLLGTCIPPQRKKSRGHHKFGTFIYATDILKRKESKK